MMDKQIDPMSEEPHDQLDQQASVSADPPGTRRQAAGKLPRKRRR